MTSGKKIAWLSVMAGWLFLTALGTFFLVHRLTTVKGNAVIKAEDGQYMPQVFWVMGFFVAALIAMIVCEVRKVGTGWVLPGFATGIGWMTIVGAGFAFTLRRQGVPLTVAGAGYFCLALAAGAALFFVIEYGVLRALSLSRIGAIVRITYYEALLQPFTLIILGLGVLAVAIFAFLPFFAINEEDKIFRDVGMSFCIIFTLPVLIFASSKVIDEEIENRTMLTLMSKPVSRWQVVVGKYLGVLTVCTVVISIVGIAVIAASYVRYFYEMNIDYMVAYAPGQREALDYQNDQYILALVPSLVLKFLQIATLAAVAVAVSTRFGLAFNVTVIVMLFILANLTQFVDTLGLGQPWKTLVVWLSNLLPHLNLLDIDQRLIYGRFSTPKYILPDAPEWGAVWNYLAMSATYSVIYIGAALSAAIALFRTRELS
jgi:ABC-type transport system involved in multi-copper enzyme maturation permease subunit